MKNKIQGILNLSVTTVFSLTVTPLVAKMGKFYRKNGQILQFLLRGDKAIKNKVQEILNLLVIAVFCVTAAFLVAKMGKSLWFMNPYAW